MAQQRCRDAEVGLRGRGLEGAERARAASWLFSQGTAAPTSAGAFRRRWARAIPPPLSPSQNPSPHLRLAGSWGWARRCRRCSARRAAPRRSPPPRRRPTGKPAGSCAPCPCLRGRGREGHRAASRENLSFFQRRWGDGSTAPASAAVRLSARTAHGRARQPHAPARSRAAPTAPEAAQQNPFSSVVMALTWARKARKGSHRLSCLAADQTLHTQAGVQARGRAGRVGSHTQQARGRQAKGAGRGGGAEQRKSGTRRAGAALCGCWRTHRGAASLSNPPPKQNKTQYSITIRFFPVHPPHGAVAMPAPDGARQVVVMHARDGGPLQEAEQGGGTKRTVGVGSRRCGERRHELCSLPASCRLRLGAVTQHK